MDLLLVICLVVFDLVFVGFPGLVVLLYLCDMVTFGFIVCWEFGWCLIRVVVFDGCLVWFGLLR